MSNTLEARLWLVQCTLNMGVKLGLTHSEVAKILFKEFERYFDAALAEVEERE